MSFLLCVFVICLSATALQAQPFEYVRIGDVDGFGWDTGTGLTAANGGPCNLDGIGVLTAGDYLPDLNLNGVTATGQGDDWDNRTALELTGTAITAVGASDSAGTLGSEFTDVTISTSFDEDPGSYPGFVFDFFVAGGAIDSGADMFINVVFGDYDVFPASVRYTRADGTTFEAPLTLQGSGNDGLIQSAFATLPFSDVFTAEGTGWRGSLLVDFVAPSEPYLAFDFAEVSTEAIGLECEPLSQGYWHRQCLGVPESEGGIDPGNGNGPQEPTEPDFVPYLMDCAEVQLEAVGFPDMTTCEGMDADPPNDACEKAKKQFTALLLNVCSGRLSLGCATDLGEEGCSSENVGDLITEIAGLILDGACSTAQSCAGAVNEGHGLAGGGGGSAHSEIEAATEDNGSSAPTKLQELSVRR